MKKRHDPQDEPQDEFRVGKAIAARRVGLGLTQAQLAEMVDVGQEFISRLERKATPPKLDTLRKICDALNCSVGDLLQREPTNNHEDERLAAVAVAMRDLTEDERDAVVNIVRHVSDVMREHRRGMVPKVKARAVVSKDPTRKTKRKPN